MVHGEGQGAWPRLAGRFSHLSLSVASGDGRDEGRMGRPVRPRDPVCRRLPPPPPPRPGCGRSWGGGRSPRHRCQPETPGGPTRGPASPGPGEPAPTPPCRAPGRPPDLGSSRKPRGTHRRPGFMARRGLSNFLSRVASAGVFGICGSPAAAEHSLIGAAALRGLEQGLHQGARRPGPGVPLAPTGDESQLPPAFVARAGPQSRIVSSHPAVRSQEAPKAMAAVAFTPGGPKKAPVRPPTWPRPRTPVPDPRGHTAAQN